MIVSGLDPGKNGALVTLFEDGSTIVNRVPLLPGKIKPGKKTAAKIPDEVRWSREWRQQLEFTRPDAIVYEDVHAWKGQGAGASFSFGRSMGFAMATVLYIDVPMHPANPGVWKARMKIAADKKLAIREALRLIPSLAPHLRFDKDDGVAEAGLLAYYGLMTISAK